MDIMPSANIVSETMTLNNFDFTNALGSALNALQVPLLLGAGVAMIGIVFFFYGDLLRKLKGESDYYSTPEPKPIKKKPEDEGRIYESDDGKGYWVKGYGDEITYVPRTALYPEGTDMKELEELKERNAENGQGRKTK